MAASQNGALLRGRLILVVQRRWLIALQLPAAFKAEGARVVLAHDATSGALSADAPDLAAAVLDSGSVELRRKLKERGIPFVVYTARVHIVDDREEIPVVRKPASGEEVVEAMRKLLSDT
jgi:DNA-binding response OmpR family regulator